MKEKIVCQLCKKEIKPIVYEDGVVDYPDVYEYRGFEFHEACFDEGIKKVDYKRSQVIETVDASVKSQANGEWHNGGYKTMKTDVSGSPIPSNINEPQILKDYEKGLL